jgi:hypothetical protein
MDSRPRVTSVPVTLVLSGGTEGLKCLHSTTLLRRRSALVKFRQNLFPGRGRGCD